LHRSFGIVHVLVEMSISDQCIDAISSRRWPVKSNRRTIGWNGQPSLSEASQTAFSSSSVKYSIAGAFWRWRFDSSAWEYADQFAPDCPTAHTAEGGECAICRDRRASIHDIVQHGNHIGGADAVKGVCPSSGRQSPCLEDA
jgi:hypothetical protein